MDKPPAAGLKFLPDQVKKARHAQVTAFGSPALIESVENDKGDRPIFQESEIKLNKGANRFIHKKTGRFVKTPQGRELRKKLRKKSKREN